MTRKGARLFALWCTGLATVLFLSLTVDSHQQFGRLTNAQNITAEVTRGKDVWHKYNCINCHTLFGEGAYYAPDLTKIAQHRGEAYLTAYMKDPAQFYDEKKHRAPVVVAKGTELLALKIREIATEHGVPIVEAPPLARALHKSVEIGREVPAALYVTVAQVLTYVYQLRAARERGAAPPPPWRWRTPRACPETGGTS